MKVIPTLRTSIALTMVLVAGMLLTGCSKDSDNMETKGNTKQQQALIKEQIIGVWRDGDYWVSFSEDGFYSAFFLIDGCERIDDGDYTIEKDTVTIKNYEHTTKLAVKSLSPTSIAFVMNYNYPLTSSEVQQEMSYTKSDGVPCKQNDALVGKTFSYVEESPAGGEEITFANHIPHNDRIIVTECAEQYQNGGFFQYYVYLSPYIYHVRVFSGYYPKGAPIKIGKIVEQSDGSLSYEKVR